MNRSVDRGRAVFTPPPAMVETGDMATVRALLRPAEQGAAERVETMVHLIRPGVRCATENRARHVSHGDNLFEIVVGTEGFIPLWADGVTLRWRFQEASFQLYADPVGLKAAVQTFFAKAILAWGDAAPIKFVYQPDGWDFEIVMRNVDDCDPAGCVLASAFFPDAGQHQLVLYPKLFDQDEAEVVETLIHETGHIFGLRHFFALERETAWPAEVYGEHEAFSIMNYGDASKLTDADKRDLATLYREARAGRLKKINATPIRLVKPFHISGHS